MKSAIICARHSLHQRESCRPCSQSASAWTKGNRSAAKAADRFPFVHAEALCEQGRQLSRWWREWRAQMIADFMTTRGWTTLAGRGRGPLVAAEMRYLEGQQDAYFRAPGHRREGPPGYL